MTNNKLDIIEFQTKWPIRFCWEAWYGIDRQYSNKGISDNFIQD